MVNLVYTCLTRGIEDPEFEYNKPLEVGEPGGAIYIYHIRLVTIHKRECQLSGTDISTSTLAPASEFLKKGLLGKYILVFTCPNGQADFLNTKHSFL